MGGTIFHRLTDADLSYQPDTPGFSAIVAADLPPADSDLSGYDADILALATDIANEPDEGGLMDGFLSDAAFTAGDFQSQTYAPIFNDFGGFTNGYEQQLVGYEGGLEPDPSPDPSAPQPDPPPGTPSSPGAPADPCAQDFSNLQPCGFTDAQMASFTAVVNLGRISQNCPVFVYHATAFELFGNGMQLEGGVVIASGDTSVLSWSAGLENPYQKGLFTSVILTFQTAKAGQFSFQLGATLYPGSVSKQCGVCIEIGTLLNAPAPKPPLPPGGPQS
jgi:hypothetical protein